MTDWKKLLGWICRVRDENLHRKHLALWRMGAYGEEAPMPARNGFSVVERRTTGGFAVEVTVTRRERPMRPEWVDRVAEAFAPSANLAYYRACESILTEYEPLGKGVTPEEAFARMEFSIQGDN